MVLENRLKPTWDWALNVMDATEAQLRFGASLTHSTDPAHPLHPLHLNSAPPQATSTGLSGLNVLGGSSQSRTRLIDSSSSGSRNILSSSTDNQRNFDRDNYAQSSRRDFLTYALSLMRSHSSEHRDSLPVLDITALRHIAYVVDGIVYYMRSSTDNDKSDSSSWTDADENENDDSEYEIQMNCDNESIDDELSNVSGNRHTFFQRSESTLCLGCPPPDPFNLPMSDALPLADQPHLLHPNASREDLFGIPKQPDTLRPSNGTQSVSSPLELPPTHLGMSSSSRTLQYNQQLNTSKEESSNDVTLQDDQSMLTDVDEKSEKKPELNDTAKAGTSSSNQSAAGPSTSKETPTQGYNIYMQLKKKTYFDFYENDKRTDTPQDLSTTKTSTDTKVKMELDGDTEMNDADSESRSSTFDAQQSSDSSTSSVTIRPQIIVSPRKTSAFAKTMKSESGSKESSGELSNFALSQNDSSSSALNASSETAGQNTTGSPSKSVIVRAGPSASLVSRFLGQKALFSSKFTGSRYRIDEKSNTQFALIETPYQKTLSDDLKMIQSFL